MVKMLPKASRRSVRVCVRGDMHRTLHAHDLRYVAAVHGNARTVVATSYTFCVPVLAGEIVRLRAGIPTV